MEFLRGADRVESVAALGRMVRMGSPASLVFGDAEAVQQHVRSGNQESALSYGTYFFQLNLSMVGSGYEWLVRWAPFLEREVASEFHSIAADAHARWKLVVERAQPQVLNEPVYSEVFSPTTLNANELSRYEAGTSKFSALVSKKESLFEQFKNHVDAADFGSAGAKFQQLWESARTDHDLILQYVWAYASATASAVGEGVSQEALAWTLQNSPSYKFGMELLKVLKPEQVAGALAEHLRGHLSGPNRTGAVQILEEEDCFRIIMNPCGSGGVMRRRGCGDALLNFAAPTGATFSKENVPAYCSHCAQNEIATTKLLGYPAWVADFDHNPEKPCGWRIYKNPNKIPEHYFQRIGVGRRAQS